MIIDSDFRDYYDAYTTKEGKVFTRQSKAGLDKRGQFDILTSIGALVPPIGSVEDVAGMWWEEEKCYVIHVVLYNDLQTHCGEGKELFDVGRLKCQPSMDRSRDKAIEERYYGKFCSAFIGPLNGGESFRYLQVGRNYFWLFYKSTEDWRSNVGEGEVELLEVHFDGCTYKYPLPLYAIDFVQGKNGLYAIDFNVSPGIGNVLKGYMTHKEIHDEIERCLL